MYMCQEEEIPKLKFQRSALLLLEIVNTGSATKQFKPGQTSSHKMIRHSGVASPRI